MCSLDCARISSRLTIYDDDDINICTHQRVERIMKREVYNFVSVVTCDDHLRDVHYVPTTL